LKLSPLLARYGLWAILVGAFVEGETIVVLGGFFAHRHILNLYGVIACAFAGSLAGDQLAYFIGRKFGARVLDWRPRWRPAAERARLELERRDTFLLISFRFFYGLRNAVPFVAGLAGIPPRRFAPLNVIGAALWAPTITLLGYTFGRAVERILEHARHYEAIVFGVLLVVGIGVFVFHRLRSNAKTRGPRPDTRPDSRPQG
jgi:membrane protein DedA with SNARE-associated domain